MPHKCIQKVSEEGLLESTYTKTGKELTTSAFISAYVTQKAQSLEVLGEGKGAVIFSIYSKET